MERVRSLREREIKETNEIEIHIPPMPNEIARVGFKRAPSTLIGIIGGGLVGAAIAGPPGALVGAMLLGSLGLVMDGE